MKMKREYSRNCRSKLAAVGWQGVACGSMRLLDRYLLREMLVPLGYCLSGFLVFWVAFDLFSELGDLQEHKMRAGDIALYYVLKAPELLVIILPMALLL